MLSKIKNLLLFLIYQYLLIISFGLQGRYVGKDGLDGKRTRDEVKKRRIHYLNLLQGKPSTYVSTMKIVTFCYGLIIPIIQTVALIYALIYIVTQ